MLNVVLVEPEIPQNTGNIARTCACTDTHLHLVKPLGFDISEKSVKRAGLDYWDKLNLTVHESLSSFFSATGGTGEYFFCSTKATKTYADTTFPDGCFLVFGKETKGLDEQLIRANLDRSVRIPMNKNVRSLNLSNSVAIILFEALRQHNFFGNI